MQDLENVPPVEPSDKKTRLKNIVAYASFFCGVVSIINLTYLFKEFAIRNELADKVASEGNPFILCWVPLSIMAILLGMIAIKSKKKMFAILGMVYTIPSFLCVCGFFSILLLL